MPLVRNVSRVQHDKDWSIADEDLDEQAAPPMRVVVPRGLEPAYIHQHVLEFVELDVVSLDDFCGVAWLTKRVAMRAVTGRPS